MRARCGLKNALIATSLTEGQIIFQGGCQPAADLDRNLAGVQGGRSSAQTEPCLSRLPRGCRDEAQTRGGQGRAQGQGQRLLRPKAARHARHRKDEMFATRPSLTGANALMLVGEAPIDQRPSRTPSASHTRTPSSLIRLFSLDGQQGGSISAD